MTMKALQLVREINRMGFEALLVGGCVRDLMLGRKPKDFDIATNCPPHAVEARFKCHDIGKNRDFMVSCVEFKDEVFEVASFRSDDRYGDSRRPDRVFVAKTFEEDSRRRDFTINAMGMRCNGAVVDFHNGLDDLKNKVIRTVGNPMDRFFEDRLRILRCLRFAAVLGFDIEMDTLRALRRFPDPLKGVSPERVRQELFKVAEHGGKAMAEFIRMSHSFGVLRHFLPEISAMAYCEHTIESHPEGDVFDHTMFSLEVTPSRDPMVVLSILFHDVCKPMFKDYNEEGRVRYIGHDQSRFALPMLKRLKFSNREIEEISFCIDNHMTVYNVVGGRLHKILGMVRSEFFPTLLEVAFADSYCTVPNNTETERIRIRCNRNLCGIIDRVASIEEELEPDLGEKLNRMVSGDRIMELAGLKPCRAVGEIKSRVVERVLDMLDGNDIASVDLPGIIESFIQEATEGMLNRKGKET